MLKGKPFVKWAGGKRQIIDKLLELVPYEFDTYYEPFIGGGALLFELSPEKAVINDYNAELMNVYECIKDADKYKKMCSELNHHETNHSEEYYYEIRNKDRDIQKFIKMVINFVERNYEFNLRKFYTKLESKEYIVSHKEKEENMPDKAVYTITDKGNDYFNRLMNDISNYDVSLYLDFNIIITNLDLVDDEQKKILVSNIKSKILELKELLNERQSHRQHIPNVGKQMFKQQLALVETLEKWIIDFENSLKGQN